MRIIQFLALKLSTSLLSAPHNKGMTIKDIVMAKIIIAIRSYFAIWLFLNPNPINTGLFLSLHTAATSPTITINGDSSKSILNGIVTFDDDIYGKNIANSITIKKIDISTLPVSKICFTFMLITVPPPKKH